MKPIVVLNAVLLVLLPISILGSERANAQGIAHHADEKRWIKAALDCVWNRPEIPGLTASYGRSGRLRIKYSVDRPAPEEKERNVFLAAFDRESRGKVFHLRILPEPKRLTIRVINSALFRREHGRWVVTGQLGGEFSHDILVSSLDEMQRKRIVEIPLSSIERTSTTCTTTEW